MILFDASALKKAFIEEYNWVNFDSPIEYMIRFYLNYMITCLKYGSSYIHDNFRHLDMYTFIARCI